MGGLKCYVLVAELAPWNKGYSLERFLLNGFSLKMFF
jgi:hypothetical protein